MSPTETLRNFTVGAIEVSPQHNTLRLATRSLTVQPKVMAVLYYLAQHQARVVGNEELLQAVWQGRVVTLASVQKSINALRTALADLGGEQEFVAYFSKRGYQLMQPVNWPQVQSLPAPPLPVDEEVVTTNTEPSAPPAAQELTHASVIQADAGALAHATQAQLLAASRSPRVRIAWSLLLVMLVAGAGYWALAGHLKKADEASLPTIGLASNQPNATTSAQAEVQGSATGVLPWQLVTQYLPAASNAHHTTPNPASKRAAYLRDTEVAGGTQQSDLMIRDPNGADWLLARSNSAWVDLAWSPSGRALAALEIYRADGLLKDPDFYQSPQYLYNIHLFTLDLKGQHLLEKNLLSQWQGKVNSITWWDENTLEFVATMGANLSKERYRYSITDQTLTSLAASPSGFQPLVSRVRNKITALISRLQDKTQVEFFDEQQNLLGKHTVAPSLQEISWGPDGAGVFGLETQQNKIHYLPIGKAGFIAPLPAPLNTLPAGALGNLKITSDGKAMFITASSQPSQVYHQNQNGINHLASINNLLNDSIAYSPDGNSLIYATQHNNGAQLWLLKNNQAVELYTSEGPIQHILWPSANEIIVQANNKIALYQLSEHKWTPLLDDAQDLTPLAFLGQAQQLIVIKLVNEVRNIWRVNLATNQYKQLTFGEVGTARHCNSRVLFQYANQNGLWQLNTLEPNHTALGDQMPQHSQLLGATAERAYFVTGGPCRESDIHQLDLIHNTVTPYLKRQTTNVRSLDFSTVQGVLQTPCAPKSFASYDIRVAE